MILWSGWVILFAPLAACLGIVGVARKSRAWSAGLAIAAMGISFLCCAALLPQVLALHEAHSIEPAITWVEILGSSGGSVLHLEFGLLINPLSVLMSMVVTGVGFLIFLYSVGYMAQEPGFNRYFAFLSLFATSMLGIVLANNFITLFIFWELVGASSYLLIGYWYERPKAAEAGKKAFLVNRIADFGFLLGILMLWSLSGEPRTLNFVELAKRLPALTTHGILPAATSEWIAALLFCGVVGKSAQFPLHVWLPDAMEGPTPVSALIHAATMVAAGVYLLARVFFLFSGAPHLLGWIATLGGFTAFFAASLALVENDIKRVLAYSTLSQLGFMVMALGLGGLTAGMYHLTTHAFFKALLFMGAGCVIHAMNTNNIWEMGGVRRSMPITFWTFLIATCALCGIPPLSGFFSKDEILTLAFERNHLLWMVATLTAGMTAFYMGRVLCVTFLGTPRSHTHHAHEAPAVMTLPLMVLAFLSAAGGFLGIPAILHGSGGSHVEFHMKIAVLSSLVGLGGLGLAFLVYAKGFRPVGAFQSVFGWARLLLIRKYFVDEVYTWINQNVQQRLALLLALFERYVVIGLWANGIAKITGFAGGVVRLAQTGTVQAYAVTLVAGLSLLLYVSLR